MNNKKWLIFPTIVIIGIIIMTVVAYKQLVTSTTLTEKDIISRIEALYGGKVDTILKDGSQYNVTFSVEDYIYEVVANEEYGTFEQLVVIKEGTPSKEHTPDDAPPTAEDKDKPSKPAPTPSKPKPNPAPAQVRLTEQQVIAIARKNAAGVVEDTEFYPNNSGGYYIVELENEDEDDDSDDDSGGDVTLQIHAITGKILSVSFED